MTARSIAGFGFVLLLAAAAAGETLGAGGGVYWWPGCTTLESYKEFARYFARDDRDGWTSLMASGECRVLPVGTKVSVIERAQLSGATRVRAHLEAGSVQVWVPSGAIE
jgi:hypothetical protein